MGQVMAPHHVLLFVAFLLELPVESRVHVPSLALPCAPRCSRHVYSVLAPEPGTYSARLPAGALRLLVNGAPTEARTPLLLRRGVNTVDVTAAPSASSPPALEVEGALEPPLHGAPQTFVEVEAEDAQFNGTVIGPSFEYTTLAAEASGRRAVSLSSPLDFLQFVLPSPANAMSIRYSIPDGGPQGFEDTLLLLVNSSFVQPITLTSNFTWFYGLYPFTKNASEGKPHHFFDEVRFLLPSLLPAGTLLRLQRPAPAALNAPPLCIPAPLPLRVECGYFGINASTCLQRGCCWNASAPASTTTTTTPGSRSSSSSSSAPTCFFPPSAPPPAPPSPGTAAIAIDLADFFLVDPPSPQPPGSYSLVADGGADPSGARDASAILQAALSVPGRVVWVPPGSYLVTQHIVLDAVSLLGAGPWHSVLRGAGLGLFGKPAAAAAQGPAGGGGAFGGSVGVNVHGLSVVGDVRIRNDSSPLSGFGGALSSSVVANVFISHQKCGMWLDGPLDSLLITGMYIHDTMADGINFHRGVSNSVVELSFLRNTGDDGLAMWSDARGGAPPNANNSFRSNTVVMPILGNNLAIYGGVGNALESNLARDSLTEGGGLHAGNRFTSVPLGGVTRIVNNSVLRGGSFSPDYIADPAALWLFALEGPMNGSVVISGNVLRDSPQKAVGFLSQPGFSITNVVIEGLEVSNAAFAFSVLGGGSAVVSNATASVLGSAGVRNCSAAFQLVDGGGNAGWNTSQCTPRDAK
jgi:hypothetical protein